jgi:predicted  nucleic acid-binding Zn-ribbon protein
MPVIRIRCSCGRTSIVNETMVGQWLRCPDCGQTTFVTWPRRREAAAKPAEDLPPDEPLFDAPPAPEALDEIAATADEPAPDGLLAMRCVRCGRAFKRARAVCPRCHTDQATGQRVSRRRPGGAAKPDAEARRRVRLPLPLKIVLGNLPFIGLTVWAARLALTGGNALAAGGAILAALVPLVTIQAMVLVHVGRLFRVKDIGLEPAAHAAIVAVGLQLMVGAVGYVGSLTAYGFGSAALGYAIAMVTLVGMGVAGLFTFSRVLRVGLVRALLLTGVAAAVLAVGAAWLDPVLRVLISHVPDFPTTTKKVSGTFLRKGS